MPHIVQNIISLSVQHKNSIPYNVIRSANIWPIHFEVTLQIPDWTFYKYTHWFYWFCSSVSIWSLVSAVHTSTVRSIHCTQFVIMLCKYMNNHRGFINCSNIPTQFSLLAGHLFGIRVPVSRVQFTLLQRLQLAGECTDDSNSQESVHENVQKSVEGCVQESVHESVHGIVQDNVH